MYGVSIDFFRKEDIQLEFNSASAEITDTDLDYEIYLGCNWSHVFLRVFFVCFTQGLKFDWRIWLNSEYQKLLKFLNGNKVSLITKISYFKYRVRWSGYTWFFFTAIMKFDFIRPRLKFDLNYPVIMKTKFKLNCTVTRTKFK